MSWIEWYHSLSKPAWTPSPGTIGLIWSLLYPVMAVSFGYVFVQVARRKWSGITVVPFALNLVANLLFMPILAGLRNLPPACVDVIAVWVTIPWCVVVAWPRRRWVALAQLPYLMWVSIAAYLQLAITMSNGGRT